MIIRRKIWILNLLLLVFIAMPFAGVFGQTEGDTNTKVTVFQLSDLSEQSQKTSELRTRIEMFIDDDEVLNTTSGELDKIYDLIDKFTSAVDTSHLETVSVLDQAVKLRSLLSRLDQHSALLSKSTKKVDDYRKQLAEDKASWLATKELSKKENFPPEVKSNIDETLKEIDAVDAKLVEHLNKLFVVINRNLQEKDKVNATLSLLNKIEEEKSSRLLSAESPAIWEFRFSDVVNKDAYNTSMLQSAWISLIDIEIYGEQNLMALISVLLAFLVLVFTVIYLKKKQKDIINIEENLEYRIIFKHPVELSLVLSVALFTPTDGAPAVLGNIVLLIIFIFVSRMLNELIHPKMKASFIVISVLLLINPFFFFRADTPWPGRFILLIESAVVILLIRRVMKHGKENFKYFGEKMVRITLLVLPLIMVLSAVAFLANMAGMVTLSKTILYASIRTVALGISFYAAALILFGVVKLILNNPGLKGTYILSDHGDLILKRTKLFINLIFGFYWIRGSLDSFGLWQYVSDALYSMLNYTIVLGKITIQVQGVVAFILTAVISWWFANLVQFVLKKELLKRFDMPRGVPNAISATVYYAILLVGFFMAISQTGVELSQLSIILGALSVGIGFGLQNIISNFISGIILVYERPIQVGDKIEVGSMLGDVTNIGVRASKIRTFDGSEVIVPNSNLISNDLTNWTLSDQKRRNKIEIGVAYGNNPRTVARLLEEVALKYDKTLKYPTPNVYFTEFGDSSLNFKLMFWTRFDDGFQALSDVAMDIYEALEKAGIEVPFPQRVITYADSKPKKESKAEYYPAREVKNPVSRPAINQENKSKSTTEIKSDKNSGVSPKDKPK